MYIKCHGVKLFVHNSFWTLSNSTIITLFLEGTKTSVYEHLMTLKILHSMISEFWDSDSFENPRGTWIGQAGDLVLMIPNAYFFQIEKPTQRQRRVQELLGPLSKERD